MLIRATIENVLSYDAPVVFSMEAGRITRQHMDHVVKVNGARVLRGAIMYGPNAAGKSNFITALYLLVRMLRHDSCRLAFGKHFRLTPRPRRLMSWELIYSHGNAVFRYVVKTDGMMVAEEVLDVIENDDFVNVFTRNKLAVRFGEKFRDEWFGNRSFQSSGFLLQKFFSDGIIERAETISGAPKVVDAIRGLRMFKIIGPYSIPVPDSLGTLLNVGEFTDFLEQILKVADLGIDGVFWRECLRREADMVLSHSGIDGDLDFGGSKFFEWRNSMWVITVDGKKRSVRELRFKHKGVPMPMGNESDGTIRMLHLSVFLFSLAMIDNIWLIDEIDSHLHPFLTRYILQEFLSTRESAAQIIATAHDTTLMTHDIWRTDEVWFAEKRVDGSSDLYSLYKYTPRFDKKLDKGYLQGLYGAIPSIGGEMLDYGKTRQDI